MSCPIVPTGNVSFAGLNGGGGNRTRERFLSLAEPRYVPAWKTLKELRFRMALETALEQRDGFECFYCGDTRFFGGSHIDHVVPRPRGSDALGNLVFACATCNLLKGRTPGWYFVFWLAAGRPSLRAAEAA